MTPEQIDLVERSVTELAPVLEDVVADFYEDLFAADPAVEAMFAIEDEDEEGGDLAAARFTAQQAKFAAQLSDILLAIRNHDRFLREAEGLGAHHAGYGVTAHHYDLVGRSLLAVLARHLGDRWTPPLADAWRLAYRLTAEAMLIGAARAALHPVAHAPTPSHDGPVR
jgi:hemoglobin-like flavoprotein